MYYRDFPSWGSGGQPIVLVPEVLRNALSFSEAMIDYSVEYNIQTGEFSKTGVAPGKYFLAVYQNPDVLPTFQTEILLNNGEKLFPATSVAVAAGETTFVDIPLVLPPEWLTPVPTPTCPATATASIAGHITVIGPVHGGYSTGVGWIPADTPQPIGFEYVNNHVTAGSDGNYEIRCLEPGEYLLFLGRGAEVADPMPEAVRLHFKNDEWSVPARRVRVDDGEAVAGIDFTVIIPTPQVIVDYAPTFTPTPVYSFPDAGSSGQRANHRIAAAVTVGLLSSVALLAGCLGVRYRPTRRAGQPG